VTAPPFDPDEGHPRRWAALAVLSLSLIVIGLDNTILNVALPSLQTELDASASTLQWIVDSYLLVFAGLLLTLGTVGDRLGRKRALQAGVAIFGGASLLVVAVDSASHLIALRAVMGVGAALIMPATLSIVTNIFPRREQPKAIAAWAGMAALGIGLGPVLGGALLEWADWRWIFLVNVPIAAAAFALGVRLIPESRDPRPDPFDLPGAALSIAALGVLVYGIIEAPVEGWTDGRTLVAFGLAAVLGAAFLIRERTARAPMLDLAYFRNPRFSVASLAVAMSFFSLFGAMFALTQYLQSARGYTALEAGLVMTPIAVGLMLGAAVGGALSPRTGTTVPVAGGLAVLAGLLASTAAWSTGTEVWFIAAWHLVTAFALGVLMGPATDSVMGAVPRDRAGVASAMSDVTRQVGGALGVAVIGSLVSTVYRHDVGDPAVTSDPRVAAAAEESVGAARAAAATLPPGDGQAVLDDASRAFTDAMGLGFVAAGGVTLVAALMAWRLLPGRDRETAPPAPAAPLPEMAGMRP